MIDVINNLPIVFNETGTLLSVLTKIDETKITQFPVRTIKGIDKLLTTNSISLWLSNKIDSSESLIEDISEVKISKVILYNELKDSCRYINRNCTVDDFIILIDKNRDIGLWIITENGLMTEKPLSVVSTYDYPSVYKHVLKL